LIHKESLSLSVRHVVMFTAAAAPCQLAVFAGAWCSIAVAMSATEVKPNGDLVSRHSLTSRWVSPWHPSDLAASIRHQERAQLTAERRRPAAMRRQAVPLSNDGSGRRASAGVLPLSLPVDRFAVLISQATPPNPTVPWQGTTSWNIPGTTNMPPPPPPSVVCGRRKLLMGQCKCSLGTWRKPCLKRKSGYACKNKCGKGWVDQNKFFPKRFHRELATFLNEIFLPMMAEACTKRDDAYCICGVPRKKAEAQFKKDMLAVCSVAPRGKNMCRRKAHQEWRSAGKKRLSQFESEQKKACACA